MSWLMVMGIIRLMITYVFRLMIMAVSMIWFMMVDVTSFLLKMNIKIKRIQPAYHLPAKMQMIPFHAQAAKRMLQHRPVRPKIQKRSDRHIPADS